MGKVIVNWTADTRKEGRTHKIGKIAIEEKERSGWK
jgi:hypothetical protein